jgi:deazaflavin-dependent oxidoreductase (nitroreductase family)
MPSDFRLKTMNAVHRVLLKASGGRIGSTLADMPVLELTTTGRKSGQRRPVMLTSPVQEGDALVIVASKGGEPEHPAWYLNLVDDPSVQVAMPGEDPEPYRATVADAGERARLWPIVTDAYDGYADYQRKTDREIPVVVLSPGD